MSNDNNSEQTGVGGKNRRFMSGQPQDPFGESADPPKEDRSTAASDASDAEDGEGEEEESPNTSPRLSGMEIPYTKTRSEVKDGRKQRSLNLRPEAITAEDYARAKMNSRFEEDLHDLDLREAALLVGYENPDLLEEKLREMGYDFFKELTDDRLEE